MNAIKNRNLQCEYSYYIGILAELEKVTKMCEDYLEQSGEIGELNQTDYQSGVNDELRRIKSETGKDLIEIGNEDPKKAIKPKGDKYTFSEKETRDMHQILGDIDG